LLAKHPQLGNEEGGFRTRTVVGRGKIGYPLAAGRY